MDETAIKQLNDMASDCAAKKVGAARVDLKDMPPSNVWAGSPAVVLTVLRDVPPPNNSRTERYPVETPDLADRIKRDVEKHLTEMNKARP